MGALDGLLVVAIEQAVAAPICTLRLADAGARVIKIERPEGETARHYDTAVKGTSAYFAWLNRGKESAILDLKNGGDLAILRAMLNQADVFVQNLIPGAMDRMGLGNDVLAREFPNLISVAILGYGQDTAYADMRAYDMLVQAESGLCSVTGTPDSPSKVGVSAADISTGMNAHSAILEALIARGKSGKGRQIEISMFDCMADWMAVPLLHFEHTDKVTGRFGLSHATIYPYRPFACSDGTLIIAVQTNAEFARLCDTALDRPDLPTNPAFATNSDRVKNRALLDTEMEPVFANLTVASAVERLTRASVAFGKYNELKDLGSHPALRRTDVMLPDGQIASMPRPAGRGPDFSPKPVPGLGQHTEFLRKEFG
ncbi:CoA transferase [Pseudosulfitobacter sp. SM2401]|uniref:CaiB/BaiF CoA transferase family protein n=1 Tax=Pseudosulfitobacter sp. SM2401 TaxID=3350098 RepID=UPI0036F1FF6D